ncbi:response regulator transcription factor [Flavobacterium zepuense]|uniref:Response regulator transcription factor n=1 Tax=Flavobacterium zepuense TaxID=2593302 RepID=A0A552V0G2_9FLAO|nr:response regulator transcription factor [Flavobacterium zepuense]TRW23967.1 response regulator transcription factor [Flavobacterium zepuense]
MLTWIRKHKRILLYGSSLALLLFLLRWLEFRFLVLSHAIDIYVGAIALMFTALGIWLTLKLTRPKTHTVIVEKEVYLPAETSSEINQSEIEKLALSRRELEVLNLMAQGMSNKEIADGLFVSLNTVKTHSSNIFEKLDVKRRTQAVEKSKRLGIIV